MRLSLITIPTLVLTFSAGILAADAPSGRPNILLVLSDDHSCPHVGCYGNPDIKTPNLDRLASEGMRFDRAYVACPQCVPSRAAIMTGRSPVRIAMTRFSAPLPMDVVTYPELLRPQRLLHRRRRADLPPRRRGQIAGSRRRSSTSTACARSPSGWTT